MILWRRVTALLVCALVIICAAMYLRDIASPGPPHSDRARAQIAANEMLGLIATSKACRAGCAAVVVGRAAPGSWRVQLRAPSWARCFVVRLSEFTNAPQRGLTGLSEYRCSE
jgi:hypothetical protein